MSHVPPGYKQTEVGVIPVEWNCMYLGELTSRVGSGMTPTGGERVYRHEGRPFLRSQNVGWGDLIMDDIAYIDEATHATFPATEIKLDDVFLNITGASIGRSAVADYRVAGGNVNQHVCIIRTDQERLAPHFLNNFLLSKAGQKQIDSFQAGGNRQGLNFGQIRSFLIPIPGILEQQAIAVALADVDALLAALDRLIAKQRALKTAAMQQLLTGRQRLPGFTKKSVYKQTQVGVIPDDWQVARLSTIAEIKTGPFGSSLHESDYVEDGTPIITVEHLGEFGVRHDNLPRVSDIDKQRLQAYSLSVNDIVFSRVGSVDRNSLINKQEDGWLFSGRLLRIRLRNNLADASYLSRYFHHEPTKQRIRSVAVGQTMASLNTQILSNIEVVLPPLDEQTAIATVLADMDAAIAALEARRAKTLAVKQGMMQELLTGRTRLR
jgi:type I restriction enzyme S subunit